MLLPGDLYVSSCVVHLSDSYFFRHLHRFVLNSSFASLTTIELLKCVAWLGKARSTSYGMHL